MNVSEMMNMEDTEADQGQEYEAGNKKEETAEMCPGLREDGGDERMDMWMPGYEKGWAEEDERLGLKN